MMAHVSVTAGWPISNQAAPRMLTNGVASVEPVTSAVRGTSGLSISVGDVTHSGDEIWYATSSSGSLASRDTGSSCKTPSGLCLGLSEIRTRLSHFRVTDDNRMTFQLKR